MLKGIGLTDEDLKKPMVLIANTWIETMPCNLGLRTLAHAVKEGVRAAGGTPMEMNTVAISDGVTMGTEGMKTSLISREMIADSVELVGRGHMFDAVIGLGACDKTLPGLSMGIARLNVPSFLIYGGTILPGEVHGKEATVRHVYEAIGAYKAGKIDDAELLLRRRPRLPLPRRLRRPVHRQHHGDGDGVPRASRRSAPPPRPPSPRSNSPRASPPGAISSTRARWRSGARPAP